MIAFSCACGNALAAEEKHAGMTVTCPQCGKQCQVPGATANIQSAPSPTPLSSGQSSPNQSPPPGDFVRLPTPAITQTTNGMAVTAFVMGLLSFCLPLLLSLAAIVFGIIGMTQTGAGRQKGRGYAVTGLILGLITLMLPVLAFALFFPSFQKNNTRLASSYNLKDISLAMHAYHEDHNKFPAVATFMGRKPLLSWRVALLPYIKQQHLYDQFHHDEPWDSPHNKTLISKIPLNYVHPLSGPEDMEKGLTHYRVFCSDPTPFRSSSTMFSFGPNSRRITSIRDGASNTIMIVEATKPEIWTKPAPLSFSHDEPLPSLGLKENDYFIAVFADARVWTFQKNEIDERNLRSMITANYSDRVIFPRKKKK